MKRILPLLFLLLTLEQASAGYVQYAVGNANSGNTATATLTGVVAGDGIRVFVCANQTATAGLTSVTVGGNAATIGSNVVNGAYYCAVADYSNSPSGSVAVVITVPSAGGNICGDCRVLAEEWSGDSTSTSLDGQNAASTSYGASGVSLPSGSFTTTTANDTLEAAYFTPQGINASAVPSGFTSATTVSGLWQTAYETGASSGSYNPAFLSGTGGSFATVMAAGFKQSAGGSCPPTRSLLGVGC